MQYTMNQMEDSFARLLLMWERHRQQGALSHQADVGNHSSDTICMEMHHLPLFASSKAF